MCILYKWDMFLMSSHIDSIKTEQQSIASWVEWFPYVTELLDILDIVFYLHALSPSLTLKQAA